MSSSYILAGQRPWWLPRLNLYSNSVFAHYFELANRSRKFKSIQMSSASQVDLLVGIVLASFRKDVILYHLHCLGFAMNQLEVSTASYYIFSKFFY
jgi:hypothetical protein